MKRPTKETADTQSKGPSRELQRDTASFLKDLEKLERTLQRQQTRLVELKSKNPDGKDVQVYGYDNLEHALESVRELLKELDDGNMGSALGNGYIDIHRMRKFLGEFSEMQSADGQVFNGCANFIRGRIEQISERFHFARGQNIELARFYAQISAKIIFLRKAIVAYCEEPSWHAGEEVHEELGIVRGLVTADLQLHGRYDDMQVERDRFHEDVQRLRALVRLDDILDSRHPELKKVGDRIRKMLFDAKTEALLEEGDPPFDESDE